jgi:predicted acylesterase/phospholipase RssA/CRP-like cAMP-binding protein
MRARFGASHRVELLHEPRDVTAVIRTLLRAGRREGDEVEVVVAEVAAAATAQAGLLRAHWPAARWVLLPEGGKASATEVRAAIEEYRQQRRIDLNAALARMELLQGLPPERLAWVASRAELRRYEVGDVVVRAGDPGDGVYFIRSGEVKILDAEAVGGERVIVRRGRGEHFGELALITGEPRSNTVVADLDSEVFFLRKAHYDELMGAEPGLGVHLSRVLSARLARAHRRHRETPRIIACWVAGGAGGGVAHALAGAIATETERAVVLLDCAVADSSLPGDPMKHAVQRLLHGAAPLSRDDCVELAPGLWRLAAQQPDTLRALLQPQVVPGLLDLLTQAFDFVVVAAGSGAPPEVMVRVAKQCDMLLLHVGHEAAHRRESGDLLALLRRECPSAESKLAVASDPRDPSGAEGEQGILLGRPVTLLPATPTGAPAARAYRRLARRLVGIGVGVSLGGGGARGAAHLGVLEVLEREGIPIDLISGTSVGSIVGAVCAMERSAADGVELWRRETRINPVRHYTLSKTALFSDRGLEGMLRRLYGDARTEALPIPFCAVATDLRRATAVPIDRGPLWLAVRASCSLPGAVAPVRMGDTYFVDGGVADNVPADIVRARGARFVIAVDISRERGFEVAADSRQRRSRLGRGLRRVRRIREFLDSPSMVQVLMRAMEVQALQTVAARAWSWSVRIRPDVADFASLDFGSTDALIERGRDAAVASLPEIRAGLRSLLDHL